MGHRIGQSRPFGMSWLVAVLVMACAGVTRAADPAAVPAAGRPNVIFILADDLGYGDLGCYGQQKAKTPRLDRMAAEGLRFTQFYAGSTVCVPSRCVLMTGLHTGHCRVRGNAAVPLAAEDVTVAEVLKQAGYRTALIGKWGLGEPGTTGDPNRQGFDHFFGYTDQTHAHNYYPSFLWRNGERVPLKNEQSPSTRPAVTKTGAGVASRKVEYSHDLVTAEALSWVEQNKDGPFFLYLAYTIPHANNEAAPRGMEVPDQGPYANETWPEQEKNKAAMISRMDADAGRLLDLLKKLDLDENTVVMFSSDNGPHKEGGSDPAFLDSNGPLRGIKRDLYDGGVRVPMIVRWPGRVPAGTVSDFVGGFQDVLPTVAELAGAQPPPPQGDGVTLVPTLTGRPDDQKAHDFLYWEFYEGKGARGARLGDWKAVRSTLAGKLELYDLKNDLAEQHDVAADHPDVVEKAEALMKQAHTPSDVPQWRLPAERRAGGE